MNGLVVWIRTRYSVGPELADPSILLKPFTTRPVADDVQPGTHVPNEVLLTFKDSGKELEARMSAPASQADLDLVAGDEHMPANFFLGEVGILARTAERFLALARQELLRRRMQGAVLGSRGIEYSLDGKQWKPNRNYRVGAVDGWSAFTIGTDELSHLRTLMDNNERPFLAWHYLTLAQEESDPGQRVILAATASELAIKEALGKLRPEARRRGRVADLYGSLLQGCAGEPSPFVSDLERLAAARNRLVHDPEHEMPTREEAIMHTSVVRAAICHLIYLCRREANLPESKWCKRERRPRGG